MEEGVCSLCQKNWPEENDLTLLCSNPDCKPLECHLFCLDSSLESVPEANRDWYCPACHPYGNLIHLLKYFQWCETGTKGHYRATRSANPPFIQYVHEHDTVGMTLRLHVPYPTPGIHIGRIVDMRERKGGGTDHFVQFRSAVNGRNLPFSCWMDLLNHDCSISEKIIQLCLPPEKNESSRWTLAVVHYLSGVKFVNQNLTSVTSNHLAKAFVEFNQDQYQPHVARNADFPNIPRKKYPEDPIHSGISPVIQAMAQCELFERALIQWRFHAKESFVKEKTPKIKSPQKQQHQQSSLNSIPVPEGLSPSSNTISPDDMVFYPQDHPNTLEYNSWLSLKRYLASGALLDGGSLHEMIQYLERLKQPSAPLSSSKSATQEDNKSQDPHSSQRPMKHSLLCSSSASDIPTPPTSSRPPLAIHPAVVSEINRSFSQTKKRKWEAERDCLLDHLANRDVVCMDLNRVSYQNANPLILTMESSGSGGHIPEDESVHSRVVCSNRDGIVEDAPNFPMVQWNDWSCYRDLKVAYDQIKLKNLSSNSRR